MYKQSRYLNAFAAPIPLSREEAGAVRAHPVYVLYLVSSSTREQRELTEHRSGVVWVPHLINRRDFQMSQGAWPYWNKASPQPQHLVLGSFADM